eukprot:4705854-Pyramimonas_sp.AAC.1
MDQDVQQQAPRLVLPPTMGEMRPGTLAMHEVQQANLAMQATRQRRHQDRQANRLLSRSANHNTAGTPASSPAMAASMQLPTLSPFRFEAGASTLERQVRIRPAATKPIISDGDFSQCAICLD